MGSFNTGYWEPILASMKTIDEDKDYYSLTIVFGPRGLTEWSSQTVWVGWEDFKRRSELRVPRIVCPEHMVDVWRSAGQSFVVVHDVPSLFLYLRVGGNALIEKTLAEDRLPQFFHPTTCVRSGPAGFRSLDSATEQELRRAPTPKQRMRILKRDDYRCRICGRRAADHVDIELHVHHIRPWSKGGLTEDINLITLCHTCHKGLDPHENENLFSMAPAPSRCSADNSSSEFNAAVIRYREHICQLMQRRGFDTKGNGGTPTLT